MIRLSALSLAGLVAAALPVCPVQAQEGTVRVIETPEVSQPGPFSTRGQTVVVPRTRIDVGGMPGGGSAALPVGKVVTGKVREVIDAGTLEVGGWRLRLYGIDAPAAGATCKADGRYWSCGRDAAFALAYETAEHWLACEVKGQGDDGTPLAACAVGPHDLGAILVGQGWALADRRVVPGYAAEEAAAKEAGAGLWRGGFKPPRR